MAQKTNIEWTGRNGKTWNPTIGCRAKSTGCQKCYAKYMAWRLSHIPAMADIYGGTVRKTQMGDIQWTGQINVNESTIDAPRKWKKPCKVFVNSMSDLFYTGVPIDAVMRIWRVMRECPQHTFIVLTKYPENVPDRLPSDWGQTGYPNVWVLTSTENQKTYNERWPLMLKFPAVVRGLSVEPMIGPIHLNHAAEVQENTGVEILTIGTPMGPDWVIVGGESGAKSGHRKYRPCEMNWIESIVTQCQSMNVPVFVKQMGTHLASSGGYVMDKKKGGIMAEWPERLRVRQYPLIGNLHVGEKLIAVMTATGIKRI